PHAVERTPQGQPVAPNARVPEPTQPQAQPSVRAQQEPNTPAAHGTPPNMRQSAAQPTENPRVTKRTQPQPPAARATPEPPARTEARPTPAPPQSRVEERPQPPP